MERIIYFDGVCNFCNGSVKFVIERDSQAKFKFASLQSEAGQAFLVKQGLSARDYDSVVLQEGDAYYIKSDAALRIAAQLDGTWSAMRWLVIVPRFLRDWVYELIARNRYRWFGRQEACMIPTPDIRSRFV